MSRKRRRGLSTRLDQFLRSDKEIALSFGVSSMLEGLDLVGLAALGLGRVSTPSFPTSEPRQWATKVVFVGDEPAAT